MVFDEVKQKFGFGCMRLPMKGDEIDYEEFSKMVDLFITSGFNYFDTAHPYVSERSEGAIKKCLSSRHERSSFLLANKLSGNYFKTKEDIRPLFFKQLELCGVEYFDFYLMHSQSRSNYGHFKDCDAYKEALLLKKEGYIRHVGFSFHDSAEFLEEILKENPEMEFVQLQINYYDWESADIQSKKCYEVCQKYHKPVIVMEPVKGGKLANLSDEASSVLREVEGEESAASFALRFAASLEDVFMVLSGMSALEQVQENVKIMKDMRPFDAKEKAITEKIVETIKKIPLIECTSCKYCTEGCPKDIDIPEIFNIMNDKMKFPSADLSLSYTWATRNRGKASDCIKCGKCERACPQHLPIRDLLKQAASVYDK